VENDDDSDDDDDSGDDDDLPNSVVINPLRHM
jgi:hypothetical protein